MIFYFHSNLRLKNILFDIINVCVCASDIRSMQSIKPSNLTQVTSSKKLQANNMENKNKTKRLSENEVPYEFKDIIVKKLRVSLIKDKTIENRAMKLLECSTIPSSINTEETNDEMDSSNQVDLPPCSICKLSDSNYLAYGEWMELDELKVHYFCLLLSTKMKQKGADDEGILGFLSKDINDCTRKHESVKCCYCSTGSATVYCQYGKGAKKCKKSFHVVCGDKFKCRFEFKGKFDSYCHEHHGIDDAQNYEKQKVNKNTLCYVCLEDIGDYDPILTIPSCCKKSYYHRECVQKTALHFGYELKCLTCGYNTGYREFIRGRGIFVPDQDASWERDENAFSELLFTYARCDAKECLCPGGREVHRYEQKPKWSIRICQCCGAKGTHKFCQQNKADVFVCSECNEVEKRLKAKKMVLEACESEDSDPEYLESQCKLRKYRLAHLFLDQ